MVFSLKIEADYKIEKTKINLFALFVQDVHILWANKNCCHLTVGWAVSQEEDDGAGRKSRENASNTGKVT